MDGLLVFMDASITTGNPVYRDSTAVITFTDDFSTLPAAGSGNGAAKCWMIDHEIATGTTVTSCNNATGNVIRISNMKQNAAGKQFKFRVLATMANTQASTISQAITKLATSAETIDDTSSLLSVTRGQSHTAGSAPLVGIQDWDTSAATPLLTAGTDLTKDANLLSLQVSQTLSLASSDSSVVTVSLPLTHTAPGADS
jgi:hypothetical protein